MGKYIFGVLGASPSCQNLYIEGSFVSFALAAGMFSIAENEKKDAISADVLVL